MEEQAPVIDSDQSKNQSQSNQIIKRRVNPQLYDKQRKCCAKARSGAKCGAVALIGSDYCRSHAKLPPLKKLQKEYETHPERYRLNSTEIERFYQNDVKVKNITSLRDELALLHAYVNKLNCTPEPVRYKYFANGDKVELPASPIPWLVQQLEIIKSIRGLALATKKIELQDKFFNKANVAIKDTVTQIVLIIDRFVTDNNLKSAIANEIFKLGGKDGESQSVIDMSKIDSDKFETLSSTEKKKMVDNTKVDTLGPEQEKKESESNFATMQSFTRDRASAELCNT
jgi:hypothetical protein